MIYTCCKHRFLRRHIQQETSQTFGGTSLDKNISSSSSSGGGGGGSGGVVSGALSSMNPLGIFRNPAATTSKAAPVAVLSEEEKVLRRERLSAAAQDRSKVWDKKLGQRKLTPQSAIVDSPVEPAAQTHADTERAIRKTKELEVRIEQVLLLSSF